MADDTKPDMTKEYHRVYGARGVGALIPNIARPAFRRRSPGAAQILADWSAIIGPELAASTAPRRLSGGRLAIACAGPVAMELQHLTPQLIARINAYLGQALVTELRFVQDFSPPAPALVPAPLVPSQRDIAAVEKKLAPLLAPLPDGPLRDALAALGRSVHAARKLPIRKHSTPHPSSD